MSLKNKNISLVNVDERNIKNSNYSFFISKIKFKAIKDIHIKLLIKQNNSDKIIGYILSYNYNRVDGHICIDCEVEDEDENMNSCFKEAVTLFCDYLYKCFPIRKIYFQVYNNSENYIMELLKEINFIQEVCLKEDTFYNNRYLDIYIFTLDIKAHIGGEDEKK